MEYLVVDHKCHACHDYIEEQKKKKRKTPRLLKYSENKAFIKKLKVKYVPLKIKVKRRGRKMVVCMLPNVDSTREECVTLDKYDLKVSKDF